MKDKTQADILLDKLNSFELAKIALEKLECSVLITGCTGSGKSTLLENSNIPESKYFDFCEISNDESLNHHVLCEDNFINYKGTLINSNEKTLILDSVDLISHNDSELLQFIKEANKYGKRLIVVTHLLHLDIIRNFFGAIITLSGGEGGIERACKVEFISQ
ncbi:hypothetical protein AB7W84_19465 [Providencia rettgeri]